MPYYAVKKGRNPGVYYDWYALPFCMLFLKRDMLLDAEARQYSLRIVMSTLTLSLSFLVLEC